MSENHTMSQIRHALHSMCSRLTNISRSIKTSTFRHALTLGLLLVSMGAWAQTNANYVPFEFYTSINQITGNFAIVNAAEGKALYGPDAQNIGYADYATAFANNRAVTQYALENAGNGNYRLRCVTPAGGNYGLWGSNPCYLNAQTNVGGVIFNLGLNNQNGQDVRNGALWKLNYVAGQGWTIQNVANNGYAAPNNAVSADPYYWQLCSLAEPNVATNIGYVITYQNNHFLGGTSTADITTFNPSTCLWTGTSGGTWINSSGYYIQCDRYYWSITNNTNSATNLTIQNQKLYNAYNANRFYYIRYNNNWVKGDRQQTASTAETGTDVLYPVTRQFYTSISTAPTLSGADQIAQTGNTTYTRTNAAYQPACYDYVFYNGAHHYCISTTADATAERPSETFTSYTWSLLNENGTAYTGANVSVNNDGVVNYQTSFANDTRLILRLKATSNTNRIFTVDKTITFKKALCTTPTITFDHSSKSVSISGAAGETLQYKTDGGYNDDGTYTAYSLPIAITSRTRVWAKATKTGSFDSEEVSIIVDNPNSMTPSTNYIGNVTAGNTVQLSYTLQGQPDANVIYDRVVYSSESTTIASVDQTGLVTAKVAGTTNIVMTLYNLDGTVKATQQIGIVVKNPFNDPNSLSVNSIDQSVNVGGTWQIVATAHGEDPVYQKFKYEVTGTSGIASVDATGLVTGLAEGTTQITVTAYNYGDVLSTLTQTINITVVKTEYIDGKKCIYSLDDIDNVNGSYILMQDITASNGLNITFSGTLDGDYHTINGLTSPLFTRLNGATVKNVILDNVNISGARTVNGTACLGAIACYAEGSTKIYNCGVQASGSTFDEKGNPVNSSSTVSGGDNTGSLVGYITGNTRVVNNYSYANVRGGQRTAGIVGRVAGTALTNANRADGNHCAVVCNMFYGDLSGSSYVSPVYAGNHTSNVQNVNEYNYWRSRANVTYNYYNNQLAVDKNEFLNRFPFYRHILNTHRELAAIYLFGSRTDANVAEIGHWYNTKNKPDGNGGIDNPTPYPIIEVWKTNTKRTTEDIKNNLPNTGNEYEGNLITTADRSGKTVGSNGYLRVNWTVHGKSGSIDLPITDMDTLNYDFTCGKVVLPFATELAEKNTYAQICTGWKITGVTGGTTGTLANYDFADRDCTAKDLYTNSGYIFAQGGNYIVPYGVTAISIEGNMATAFYLRDGSYDIGYNDTYGGATAVAGNITGQYHGQNVYTNLGTLLDAMGTATDPHQQAIVLVGNFHYNQNALGGNIFGSRTTKGLTIMSVDEDNNQEPDYGWYSYHTTDRTDIAPVRFDFVPNIGIGMAARTTGSTPYPTIGIWHGHGWFELTETCVSFMSECEINSYSFNANDNGKGNNRWIANSGYFIQIVRARDGDCTKLSYIQIGGNAYVEQLYPGSHTDNARNVTICPIIVNGGEIEECFMTGYNAGATASGQNIYFWSAGGKMHKWLGAYIENPNTNGVNVTAKVDHARIYRFFGGGTSKAARIKGNINVTMNNSLVDFYCGGPEFGDMAAGKTVTTNATGSVFGEFYGAGFGGTSITRRRTGNNAGVNFANNSTYPIGFNSYTDNRLQYSTNASYPGYGVNYAFEYILYSGGGGTGVARFYTGYADFSLAQTGDVTSNLTNCTVKNSFYGGGCQGTVNGNATSTLNNCWIEGNAFAGGYKAPETTVDVYPTTQPTYSTYTKETGLFSDFGTTTPVKYTWVNGTAGTVNNTARTITTATSFDQLGAVTGNATITIEGNTYVAGMIDGQPNGGVFGGGNESPVRGNTDVNIQTTGGNSINNVFGGGNMADVNGATDVSIIANSRIEHNVYGGGNLADVGKEVSVTLGVKNSTTDNPVISGAIYGGGALANTNTTSGNTTVNLLGGSVTDVYGGGLGSKAGVNGATADVAAIVNGNATVTLDGSIIRGNIFGANNVNGTPKGHVFVDVKTTVAKGTEDEEHPYHVLGVYGGGNLAAYVPTDANGYAEVLIEKCDNSIKDVFGGGNAAAVPATEVTVWGGQIGRVFAGGNGSSAPADVTNNTHAIIHGGTIKEVYGGSNSQGAIGGTIKVDVAELKKPENQDLCPINITDLYGGGNQADSKAGLLNIGKCSHIGSVYGGANKANIEGNIELNIIDGHIDNVFGGNNNSGQVNGNITVNVNWGAGVNAENANVGNVYGGGNIASIDNGTSRTVTVNIPNATISGSVFGGGKGKPAVIVGNTNVNIGVWSNTANAIVNGDVFGGGDLAAVEGDCNVTIRNCGTSIAGDLYGGGNAASVYSTNTTLWGGTVAGNVFGGGNGKDATKNANGAQVGYARNDETPGGSGVATTNIYGGTVGTWTTTDGVESCGAGTGGVFGGSNTNGNIRGNISLLLDERACDETDAVPCDLKLKDIYGAGNEAAYAGTGISFNLGCVSYLSEIYGGAKAADLNSDAILTITSGHFGKVFGGNNVSGKLNGKIVVTVDETGCHPVIIDELYGGGNLAAYSVYGYEDELVDGKVVVKTSGDAQPDPVVNIISCTSIGTVYGGGYGATAVMVGSPTVNINMIPGDHAVKIDSDGDGTADNDATRIGTIETVYGGGNAASVVGNTSVNVGTVANAVHVTGLDKTTSHEVGASISGNVYGGGNAADVTGKTNVMVGRD